MKKLFVFLMVAGLVMAGSGTTLVLAQTINTYNLYADSQDPLIASNFRIQYEDTDGDGKFSIGEPYSFSGVTFGSVTYTQILGVPNSNSDSPYTDGSNPRNFYWYFKKPMQVNTTAYIDPKVWDYRQVLAEENGIAVAIPGKTVVIDPEGDLLLRRCDPEHPLIPCSLPPPPPVQLPDLPGYFDIKSADITQVGRGQVDLSIYLYEPVPAVPTMPNGTPYGFISYIWQFAGGCISQKAGNKDSISLVWQNWGNEINEIWEWRAYWYEITQCEPSRQILRGDPVPFSFTQDGVKVRVPLEDLLTAIDPLPGPGYLEWHAAIRRIPFIYHPEGYPPFSNTAAVDYAPNVFEFLSCDPPNNNLCAWVPEDFATWVPR